MESYQLFKYDSCPFCHRVLRFLESSQIEMETRDTLKDPKAYQELVLGGGRPTVPCLRIDRENEVVWLYESSDIVKYLEKNYKVSQQ